MLITQYPVRYTPEQWKELKRTARNRALATKVPTRIWRERSA